MLLPICSETTNPKIFELLNDEIDLFLRNCIDATDFSRNLFSDTLVDVIYENEPTKDKFKKLWNQLSKLSRNERQDISSLYHDNLSVISFFSDADLTKPTYPENIKIPLKDLCNHLYTRTKLLKGTESCAKETIKEHCESFIEKNGSVCSVCAVNEITEVRADVNTEDQWISDYDHLLCQKHYAYWAVNPENFLPTCHICNSKAKGSKDLLINSDKTRRICFYPYHEDVASRYISLNIDENGSDSIFSIDVTFNTDDLEALQKLSSWDDVYDIKRRIRGAFADLKGKLSFDFQSDDYSEFCDDLKKKSQACRVQYRNEPLAYWKYLLYGWLIKDENEPSRRGMWKIVESVKTSYEGRVFQESFNI